MCAPTYITNTQINMHEKRPMNERNIRKQGFRKGTRDGWPQANGKRRPVPEHRKGPSGTGEGLRAGIGVVREKSHSISFVMMMSIIVVVVTVMMSHVPQSCLELSV